jgi:TM2 domain-containing membrane protein YozV
MKIPRSEPSEASPSRSSPPTKFCHECGESIRKKARICPECGVKQPEGRSKRNDPLLRQANSQKMAAGLCAIFLGAFGVHKFILGMNRQGILLLLVTVLSCGIAYGVTHTIGIIEGIIYLTKTDEEFRELYIEEKKEWF